jgi:hypothetical protein
MHLEGPRVDGFMELCLGGGSERYMQYICLCNMCA